MRLLEQVRSWFEPSDAEAQTEEVFRSVWRKTVRADSTRHPFHREVLDDLDSLLDTVVALPPDTLVKVNRTPTRWDALLQDRPWVSRRLTSEWIRSFVVSEVARVGEVADSTDYLTVRVQASESKRGEHELTVQHRLSGLRVVLLWGDGAEVGRVFAKSYSIASIDPDRRWPHEGLEAVHEWEGLGITSRLYLQGASLQPDLRWGVSTLTERSAALRRRLHRGDPWRFAAANDPELHPMTACLWCIENGWAKLDRAAFNSHP